jgi:RHS repeat-associated protein
VFDEDNFSPVAKIKGDKQYSILSDYLGTPTHVFDFEGDVIWETRLDSYGKMQLEKGKIGTCPFRYQGQYEDYETGLYYNRFRYYSPEEGQYLQQDPIGLNSGDIGLYNYVNDVNIWVDIFGLSKSSCYTKKDGPLHHIATNKNEKRGKKWTKRYKPFFDKAGLDMDGPENKVYVPGHKGPHPDDYHQHVFDKLSDATEGINHRTNPAEYKNAVKKALSEVASDAQTPGSQVSNWLLKI